MKFFRMILSTIMVLLLFSNICMAGSENEEQYVMDRVWSLMNEEQRYNSDIKYKANAVRLSVDEFQFFANVIEAESDRSSFADGTTTDGRIYVAACIWDRVFSNSFPDTVTSVLCQSGQFSTVSNGWCSTRSTSASEWAIIKGREAVMNGEIPVNMLYFNCINYFSGFTAYDKVGDNYFSTTGSAKYYEDTIKKEDE